MNSIEYIKEIIPNMIVDVTNNDIAKIQIESITGELKIKARISPELEFQDVMLIDGNYDFVEKTTKAGFYTIDTMGCNAIQIECDGDIKGFISGSN